MKYISKFEDFLNESKSIPSHVEKAIKDLAYSMPNHTKSEDGKFTDEQVLNAIKKYSPVLSQAIKNGLEKEILDGVQSYITESSVNESSDIDVTKLSDGTLKEIRKVFNGVKHGLSNNDLQLLAKLTMEIKKRGLKESLEESTVNEGVASLDSYYSNSEKSIRDSAKKIDAVLNKEIKSDATKKEILDLITELVEDYAVEYADNRRSW